jgi:hypothetical protein
MAENRETLALDLARDALSEQRVEVAEIRLRAGPVLAGAAAAAGLLAKSAFSESANGNSRPIAQSAAAAIGVAAALLVLVCAVLVLVSRRLGFSVDAGAFFASAAKEANDPAALCRRLISSYRMQRAKNEPAVHQMRLAITAAVVALGVEVAGFVIAVALAS